MQDLNSTSLFDRITIQSSNDFDNLIDTLNAEQADYITKIALEKAFNSGIFSLSESEILSKSLRILNVTKNLHRENNIDKK
jgi:hypothetical protein